LNPLKAQYERFPSPPIYPLALPKRGQGRSLSYEYGLQLAGKTEGAEHPRLLIAGCGTLEPLLVAEYHPKAVEIVAVDLSQRSLRQAKIRYWFAHVAPSRFSLVPRRRFGPVTFVENDLREFRDIAGFDYIIASNVLHHVEDPAGLLQHLSSLLRPDGLFRMVTYPKSSRTWMRRTSAFLKANGITAATPRLRKRAFQLIRSLPANDPRRLTFESQPETRTAAGIVDAFLHVQENPLGPLEWAHACKDARLELVAETQNETSRSDFLDEVVPELKHLNAWIKLQILDDLLELCSNPVLWLRKTSHPSKSVAVPEFSTNLVGAAGASIDVRQEFKTNLKRISILLEGTGIDVQTLFDRFKNEVGPRVSPEDEEIELPGLAMTDYSFDELMRSNKIL